MEKHLVLKTFVSGCKKSMGFSFAEGRIINEAEMERYFDEPFVEGLVKVNYLSVQTDVKKSLKKDVSVVSKTDKGVEVVTLDAGIPMDEAEKDANPRRLIYPKNMYTDGKKPPKGMPVKVVEEARFPLNTVERPTAVPAPEIKEEVVAVVASKKKAAPAKKAPSPKKAPAKKGAKTE